MRLFHVLNHRSDAVKKPFDVLFLFRRPLEHGGHEGAKDRMLLLVEWYFAAHGPLIDGRVVTLDLREGPLEGVILSGILSLKGVHVRFGENIFWRFLLTLFAVALKDPSVGLLTSRRVRVHELFQIAPRNNMLVPG